MIEHADQYTPEEILAAARNAEADGRLDYAVQFYTHLAETRPTTSSGYAAREALARLQAQRTAARGAAPREASAPFPTKPRIDDFDPSPVSMAERLAIGAQRSGQRTAPLRSQVPPGSPLGGGLVAGGERQPSAYDYDAVGDPVTQPSRRARQSAVPLPRRQSGFLAGRVLAWCVTTLGLLCVIGAIAFLALAMLDARRAGEAAALLQLPTSPTAIGALLLVGFAAVLAGQLMSAVFVTAIETRDVARVLRARDQEQ